MSETLDLEAGPWRAEIAPARGGRITRLSFAAGPDRVEVLEPIEDWRPAGRAWPAAGLYPLVPYSNRIENGLLRVGNRAVRLKIHAFGHPHAMHGPGHRRAWVATARSTQVDLLLTYEADDDWPWPFEARLTYAIEGDRFIARIGLRNDSTEPMPAGLGLHPFFRAPKGSSLAFRYQDSWPQSERDPSEPQFGQYPIDLKETLTDEPLMRCFGRWGRAATIERPDLQIRLDASAVLRHLVVYRAAGSTFLCVEPVSHVTNGFHHHAVGLPCTGAIVLDPGGRLEAEMAIRCSRPSAPHRSNSAP
jgi:aldose 1-epimerase